MTKREAAIVTAYTGFLLGNMADFQAYAEEKLGRSVWTHELATKKTWALLKDACKEDFMALPVT